MEASCKKKAEESEYATWPKHKNTWGGEHKNTWGGKKQYPPCPTSPPPRAGSRATRASTWPQELQPFRCLA